MGVDLALTSCDGDEKQPNKIKGGVPFSKCKVYLTIPIHITMFGQFEFFERSSHSKRHKKTSINRGSNILVIKIGWVVNHSQLHHFCFFIAYRHIPKYSA